MATLSKPRSLMDLPAELRLRVYELLFTPTLANEDPAMAEDANVRLSRGIFHKNMPPRPRTLPDATEITEIQSAILATNKQVFHEAMPVLYKNFTFNLSMVVPCFEELYGIPVYAWPYIRNLLITASIHKIFPRVGPLVLQTENQRMSSVLNSMCSALPRLNCLRMEYYTSLSMARFEAHFLSMKETRELPLQVLSSVPTLREVSIHYSYDPHDSNDVLDFGDWVNSGEGKYGLLLHAVRKSSAGGEENQDMAFEVRLWDDEVERILHTS